MGRIKFSEKERLLVLSFLEQKCSYSMIQSEFRLRGMSISKTHISRIHKQAKTPISNKKRQLLRPPRKLTKAGLKKLEDMATKDKPCSQQKMAVALGVHQSTVSRNIKKSKVLESSKVQHENVRHRQMETAKSLKELRLKFSDSQARHKKIISGLKFTIEEGAKTKERLETDVNQLRCKVQTLQTALDNSEVVQRDFVKLSQTLQVQLEKIRLSEKEVRWQHEEDVEECPNCKESLTTSEQKPHCNHCGWIFCFNCLKKMVRSGPSNRPSKVCDLCHTLLDPNAVPYFSTEPLHTPHLSTLTSSYSSPNPQDSKWRPPGESLIF